MSAIIKIHKLMFMYMIVIQANINDFFYHISLILFILHLWLKEKNQKFNRISYVHFTIFPSTLHFKATNCSSVERKRCGDSCAQFIIIGPFTRVRHQIWQIQAGTFCPPSIFHSLSRHRLGRPHRHTLIVQTTAAASSADVMCKFLAVASFQPDRLGAKKWLLFARFCQAVTQESGCQNKYKKQRLVLTGRYMDLLQCVAYLTFYVYSSFPDCNSDRETLMVYSEHANVMPTLHLQLFSQLDPSPPPLVLFPLTNRRLAHTSLLQIPGHHHHLSSWTPLTI